MALCLLFLIGLCNFYSCKAGKGDYPVLMVNDFKKIVLPKKLLEISGLTIDDANDCIYAINDEKANIYLLSQDGKLKGQIDFGKNADYEGIEKVGNSIFILKSNGKIIEFDLTQSETIDTYDTSLSLANDTEGLGYDKSTHSLLIACKGSPNINKKTKIKDAKVVFAFDIKTKKLNSKPIFKISDDDIEQYLKTNWKISTSKKKHKSRLNRATDFSPSAVANNPIDGYYYLLSTVGKTLIVIDEESTIKWIYYLDAPEYIQPEGICFDDEGNMFISNEGKGSKSNFLKISKPDK